MYGDWVMIVSNGLFGHPNKAKKAISPSQKSSITDGLSCFFSLLGIEEWRGQKKLLEKKDRKRWKGRRGEQVFPSVQAGWSGCHILSPAFSVSVEPLSHPGSSLHITRVYLSLPWLLGNQYVWSMCLTLDNLIPALLSRYWPLLMTGVVDNSVEKAAQC